MPNRICSIVAVAAFVATTMQATAQVVNDVAALSDAKAITHSISEGSLFIQFDGDLLGDLGWSVFESSLSDSVQGDLQLSYPLDTSAATVTVEGRRVTAASIASSGGLLLVSKHGRASLVNLALTSGASGGWALRSTLGDSGAASLSFELSTVTVEYLDGTGRFRLSGDLLLTESTATALGRPDLEQITVGWVQVKGLSGVLTTVGGAGRGWQQCDAPGLAPDVIVGDLPSFSSYGSSGGISAFAVGTTSCNVGTCGLNWFSNNNQHPVIGQNLYRLKDGRFEQIGQSWLKHGFFALSGSLCSSDCEGDGSGQHLGVNCSDPYSSGLNGSQSNLGPRSEVNPTTGEYPFPFGSPAIPPTIGRRIQVHNEDLNPNLNAGASYFVEGHYIANDDAMAGRGDNNASYRAARVTGAEPTYGFQMVSGSQTQRMRPAIFAWGVEDSDVQISQIKVDEGGVLWLAVKVSNKGDGTFHYEYALHNLNSHESVFSFSIPLARDTVVTNIGFHAVESHSGEPYSNAPWIPDHDTSTNTITWQTQAFATDPNANALRWGTLYNFRFDADVGPMNSSVVTLGKFRSGAYFSKSGVTGPQTGAPTPIQCGDLANRNLQVCTGDSGARAAVLALRVTAIDVPGVVKWIDAPDASGYARLVCTPVFRNWGNGTILVADRDIVPAASYEIQSLLDGADPANEDDFSTPLSIATVPLWGDAVGEFAGGVWTAPNGVVNFQDIDGCVLAFQEAPDAPSLARMDLHGEQPNGLINFSDISHFIRAFQGDGYPFADPAPCP